MFNKIVFDTNILISSTLWGNSVAQKVLQKCIRENVQIFSSNEILEEFAKILKRDFDYSSEEAEKVISNTLQFITLIDTTTKAAIITEDPDDNKILECAIDSNSEVILTYDNHLLKLGEFSGIKIMKPESLI